VFHWMQFMFHIYIYIYIWRKYWISCQNSCTVAVTPMAWLECFCLLVCRQLTIELLYKLHLSLPTAIIVLFVWTVSKLLWRFHLIRDCVKYFVGVIFPPFLFLSLLCIFYYFFPVFKRSCSMSFHVWTLIKHLCCLTTQSIWTTKLGSKHYVAFCSFRIANTYLTTNNITAVKHLHFARKFSTPQPGGYFGYRQWSAEAVV
jgi:hypothetical protein